MASILVVFDYPTLVHETHRMPGSIGLLRFLKEQNSIVAVFTDNCDHAEKTLESVGLRKFVTHICNGDVFVEISKKSNPSFKAEMTIAVSRNPDVIRSAASLGMRTMAVGGQDGFENADHNVRSLIEVWDMLKNHLGK